MFDMLRFEPSKNTSASSKEVEDALTQLLGNCRTCFFAMHCHAAQENANTRYGEQLAYLVEREISGEISFDEMLTSSTKQTEVLYEQKLSLIRFGQNAKHCPGPTQDVAVDLATNIMICNNPLASAMIKQEIDFTPSQIEVPNE